MLRSQSVFTGSGFFFAGSRSNNKKVHFQPFLRNFLTTIALLTIKNFFIFTKKENIGSVQKFGSVFLIYAGSEPSNRLRPKCPGSGFVTLICYFRTKAMTWMLPRGLCELSRRVPGGQCPGHGRRPSAPRPVWWRHLSPADCPYPSAPPPAGRLLFKKKTWVFFNTWSLSCLSR